MKDLTLANCSTSGTNVIHERNGRSYTVQKLSVDANTSFCFMLSNLRLDGGTELSSSNSNVSSTYTLPSNSWSKDYCMPKMIHYAQLNGSEYRDEYYYNWPAATARNNSTSGTSSCSNDTSNSLGSICPKNWTLPAYNSSTNDISYSSFNTSGNPGFLATSGNFNSGAQSNVGSYGFWWSSTRSYNYNAYCLYLSSGSANRSNYDKYYGFSVRCMRSS